MISLPELELSENAILKFLWGGEDGFLIRSGYKLKEPEKKPEVRTKKEVIYVRTL